MKIDKKDSTGNGLFTMSRLGPEELTHKAFEDYLSKGRHMQSAYVTELLSRLFRLFKAGLVRSWGGSAQSQPERAAGTWEFL